MIRQLPLLMTLFLSTLILSGCEAIADIFQAGFWTGAILIAVVILVIVGIVALVRR